MDQTAASVAAPEKLPRRKRAAQPPVGATPDSEYVVAVQRVYEWMLSHGWGDEDSASVQRLHRAHQAYQPGAVTRIEFLLPGQVSDPDGQVDPAADDVDAR